MNTIKTFLLGAGSAYAVYYLTRRRADGRSILDEMLDEPAVFFNRFREQAVREALRAVHKKIS